MSFRDSALMLSGLFALPMVLAGCGGPTGSNAVDAPAASVTVLTEGGPFNSANGIMFGPDGRLYVASVARPAVTAIDPETGAILDQWHTEHDVKGPDDVAFGPDGSLFWTDILVGEVGKRTPEGVTSVVGAPGPGVNPITLSDDGRLFVSQCFLGDRLFELDPDGVEEPRLITDQLGPGCGLNGMDWGPDGRLYGPRWFQGEVVAVDVDSGRFASVASGFQTPAAVKFDSRGQLHVLDALAGEVVRLDVASGSRQVVGRPGIGLDNLAFDATDRLFVSSFADGSVVEVTGPDSVREVVAGGVTLPGGLAYIPAVDGTADRLFVADFFALRELDPTTGTDVETVRSVIGFSDLGEMMSADWDGEHLILSGWFDGSVRVWDPDTDSLVHHFEGFRRPIDAVAFGEALVVTEYDTGSVLRFTRSAPEDRAVIASDIQEPAGLAVYEDDLYVVDHGAGTILSVIVDGETVAPPRLIASGLAGPEGVTVGRDGALYVVEADAGRVTRISLEDGSTSVVAQGLELEGFPLAAAPAMKVLNDVVVGDGVLFVSADGPNRIYRIEL